MVILVTGANGQLGNSLRYATCRSSHRYIFTDIAELDITDKTAIAKTVKEYKVDAIINCAAYVQVDRAEEEPEIADRINHIAVANLAEVAAENNITLIHISTDYVFGGDNYNVPYKEDVHPNPTGVYGNTKWAGEQAIINSGCHYIIIRTAWLYSEYGKNFVKTMLNLMKTRTSLNVVFDQIGTPTYAGDLAHVISYIIESRQLQNEGIYHYSNEGVCSWYDFACAIAHILRYDDCHITPCHSNEFPSKVVRPAYSVLDKTKIKTTFGITIKHWYDSLSAMLDEDTIKSIHS